MDIRVFEPGDTVFREGDPGDLAYLIETGRVRVETRVGDRSILLAEFGANEIIGEMALIDGSPRSATVTAVEHTRLVPITKQLVSERLNRADSLTRLLLDSLLARLRRANLNLGGIPTTYSNASELSLGPLRDDIQLSNLLEGMLGADNLELHFQPIVDCRTLRPTGFEALFRSPEPGLAGIDITRLIDLSESTGLIIPLGARILERVCEALQTLDGDDGVDRGLFLSMNVSAHQLEHADFVARLVERLRPLRRGAITVEITETALLRSPESTSKVLEQLRGAGATIALDDFGTGYSSLSYLHQFPLDLIKIDRSFCHDLDDREDSQRIVRAVVSLANELGLATVAEGVETAEQLDILRDIGCCYVQGFLTGRPMPLDQAVACLAG